MTLARDDLTSLFATGSLGPAQQVRYRQGVLVEWNPVTLQNKVKVGGATLTDVPVLGVAEAASYKVGVVVGLKVVESTWAIEGRYVIPGTADATDAITQLGQKTYTAVNAALGERTTLSWGDLDSPALAGPAIFNVQIGASGKALVTISANIGPNPAENALWGAVGVDVTGPTTVAPSLNRALLIEEADNMGASKVLVFEGLTPGIYTFTLKYHGNGTNLTNFSNREIIVVAL